MLLWHGCTNIYARSLLLILLCICLEVESLDQMIILCLIFWWPHHMDFHSSYTILPMGFLCFVIVPIFPQQPAWRALSPSWAWSLRRRTQYDWQPSMARVWARSAQPPSSRLSQSVSKDSCPASPTPSSPGGSGEPRAVPLLFRWQLFVFQVPVLKVVPPLSSVALSDDGYWIPLTSFSRARWHCHSSWSILLE